MKTKTLKTLILLITISVSLNLHSQVTLIPYNSLINTDGNITNTEWFNSAHFEINSAGRPIDFFVCHDNENLYIAVDLKNENASNLRFPEILFDINNDKSTFWKNDDWWFHVSATDCYYQGNYSNYSNCETEHESWIAVPNFGTAANSPLIDSIEIKIPFSLIGINLSDTIGFALDVTNTVNSWEYFPSGAQISNPSSWANINFEHEATYVNPLENSTKTKCFVNNDQEEIVLTYQMSDIGTMAIQIFNIQGFLIKDLKEIQFQKGENITTLDYEIMKPGIYFLKLRGKNINEIIKFYKH